MSKEKQIEEMQTVINGAFFEDFRNGNGVCIKTISEHLYEQGYRKQSEGEWIWDKEHSNYKCSLCGEYDTTTPNFCRGCGAKMKGGAE